MDELTSSEDTSNSEKMHNSNDMAFEVVDIPNEDRNIQASGGNDSKSEVNTSVEQLLVNTVHPVETGNQQVMGSDLTHDSEQLKDTGNHQSEILPNQQVMGSPPGAVKPEPYKKQTWQCDKCGRIFESASAIKAHIETIHEGVLHTCEICGVTMKWKSNMNSHMRSIHNIGDPPRKKMINRKCQPCGIKFKSNYMLYHHLRTVHKESKPYKCSFCGEAFKDSQELSQHRLVHHSEFAVYSCDVCAMTYVAKGNFQRHIKKTGHKQKMGEEKVVAESKLKERGMVCANCNKNFTSYQLFRHHCSNSISCGIADNKYKCKFCKQTVHSRDELKEHLSSEHDIQWEKANRFQCPVCNKMLDQQGLKYHEKKHAGVKEYSCDQCEYECIRATDLRKHKRVHTGMKPYQCRFCSRQFRHKNDFKWHENFHFGRMPFQCTVCQRKFFGNRQRMEHQKKCKMGKLQPCLFTKDPKPIGFRCRFCHGIFTKQGSVTVHEKKCQSQTKEDLPSSVVISNEKECQSQTKGHLPAQKGQDEPGSNNGCQSQNESSAGEVEVQKFHTLPNCTFCGQIFRNRPDVSNHEKTCDKKIHADIASRKLKSRSKGVGEGESKSDNNRKTVFMPCMASCRTCGKSTVELVKEHCPLHKVSCPACQTVFESEQELETHLTSAHTEEQAHLRNNSSYAVCSTCEKTTEQVVRENHTHQFVCICSSVFATKENFDAHQADCVGRVKSNLYVCVHCSESFDSKHAVQEHRQVAHDEVVYQCCSKMFAFQNFRNHVQSGAHKRISVNKMGVSFALKQEEIESRSLNEKQCKKSVNQRISRSGNLGMLVTSKLSSPDIERKSKGSPKCGRKYPYQVTLKSLQPIRINFKPQSSNTQQSGAISVSGPLDKLFDQDRSSKPAEESPGKQIVIVAPREMSSNSPSRIGTSSRSFVRVKFEKKTDTKLKVQPSVQKTEMNSAHQPQKKVVVVYQCPYCKHNFPIQRNLKVHLRTHKDKMPFACAYCIMSYEKGSELEAHVADKHTGTTSQGFS